MASLLVTGLGRSRVPFPRRFAVSEQGWKAFLVAEGVDDWVVLHGGATAVFGVGSLGEAADLAQAITQVQGIEGSGMLLTIAPDRLTVRLTRCMFQLEPMHVELARAVSTATRSRGVVADRGAVQEVQLAIAAKPNDIDVGLLARGPGLRATGRRQRGRPARPWVHGLDAGARHR